MKESPAWVRRFLKNRAMQIAEVGNEGMENDIDIRLKAGSEMALLFLLCTFQVAINCMLSAHCPRSKRATPTHTVGTVQGGSLPVTTLLLCRRSSDGG